MAPSPQVKVAQIRAKITLLGTDVANEGVPASSLKMVCDTLDATAGAVQGDTLTAEAVDGLFTSISDVLTVASIRMGRALDLGFDLANTCRMRQEENPGAAESAFLDLFGPRVVQVQEALADLATSLPEHAARGVSLSLAEWQFWAGRLTLNKEPVLWPDPAATDALRRQGEVWRSVLAGEKLGQDMLSSDDYFSAMRELVKGQFLKRPWIWIAVVTSVALLIVGAILVLGNTAAATKVVGGVVPLLGVVGISAATVKSFAGNIARELERHVWGAELDFAIAEALTVPPGEWRVKLRKIDTPPPRGIDPHIATNARIVRKVSEASRVGQAWPPTAIRAWRVRRYMDTGFSVKPLDGASINRRTATQLIKHPSWPASTQRTSHPARLAGCGRCIHSTLPPKEVGATASSSGPSTRTRTGGFRGNRVSGSSISMRPRGRAMRQQRQISRGSFESPGTPRRGGFWDRLRIVADRQSELMLGLTAERRPS